MCLFITNLSVNQFIHLFHMKLILLQVSCVFGGEEAPFAPPSWFSECEGFGCRVAEVYKHQRCVVSSLKESALRACATKPNSHVTFSKSGTISLAKSINTATGVIIDGSGQNVRLTGQALSLSSKNIVYSMSFEKGPDDGIKIKGTHKDIWVHHCSFRNYDDGLLDITRGVRKVTVSWCRFADHDKTMLIGFHPDEDKDTSDITIHHNYWINCVQRQPRVRYAYVHVYNNVYEDWGSYAVASSQRAKVLVENNLFRATNAKAAGKAIMMQAGTDPKTGYIRAQGNYFGRGSRKVENERGNVGTPTYKYSKETADSKLYDKVKARAGAK